MLMVAIYPVIYTIGYSNRSVEKLVNLLAENNALSNSLDDCDYLQNAVVSLVHAAAQATVQYKMNTGLGDDEIPLLLWAQMLPVRCDWQLPSGVITACPESSSSACEFWSAFNPSDPSLASPGYYADLLDARVEGIVEYQSTRSNVSVDFGLGVAEFQVNVIVDNSDAISFT
jgi:hypothetical protein